MALLMLLKIPLNATLYNYGLIYGLPGVLASTAYLTSAVPSHFEQKYQLGWAVRALIGTLLIFVCTMVFLQSLGWIALKSKPLSRGADRLWTFDRPFSFGAGSDVEKFLQWAQSNIKPTETFVALPQGVMLNFLTKRTITGPHTTFMPAELATYSPGAMLSLLSAQPPDYVIFFNKETIAYGHLTSGEDYGAEIFRWVNEHYTAVWRTGAGFESHGFGITVLKKIPNKKIN